MKRILLALGAIALVIGLSGCHKSRVKATSYKLQVPAGFDVAVAMSSLFGNYDPVTASSAYDVPQTTVLDLKGSSFERGDEIVVRPFWVSAVSEGGTRKVVLLTYAVPAVKNSQAERRRSESFDCHACIPLVGAAVFVQEAKGWKVESSRAVVSRVGGWGEPPSDIRIVKVGPHRMGIEITDTDGGQGETTTAIWVLVPWRGRVDEAVVRIIADDNKGVCGKEEGYLPCYANKKKLEFVPGKNSEYYDLVLRLSGTDMTDAKPFKAKTVQGVERLEFRDGVYKTIEKTGDTTFVERSIDELKKVPQS